jgi:hypothetical protein
VVAHYVYKNAAAKPHMRVTRCEDADGHKSFPTARWAGRWAYGWPGTVVPYRLPELLAAPATVPVCIAEGEKDVETLVRLGFVATTNPGGADRWQPELAAYFAGKQTVFKFEDNDDAGRKHTAKVLAALRGIVPTVIVVSFPELSEGSDVTDWVDLGGTLQGLLARMEEARKRGVQKYTLIDLTTVKLRGYDWIWEKRLARGGLELMAGMPGLGKSLVHCQYAACVTGGKPWPDGSPATEPAHVILLTAEERSRTRSRRGWSQPARIGGS